ncbi:MAG: hypothetical protein EXS15_02605 [Phycisphaerales bacterium]|nr:hypothetical protein [Phycisphaerales bacterium]
MPLQCNLDRKGKLVRLVAGSIIAEEGLLLIYLRFVDVIDGDWPWLVGGFAFIFGTFLLIEGAIGGGVIRALGVNTPN